MSSSPSKPTLQDRFRAQARVVRWALLAGVGVALFLLWDQYMRPIADRWNKSADLIEANVAEVRASKTVAEDLQNIKDVVTGLGPVNVPGGAVEGNHAQGELLNQLLQKNGATNYSVDIRPRGNLPKAALATVVRNNRRVERLSGDLKFDATPQATMAILAALESSPDVEAVDSIRIIKDTGGKVKVHLTLEAWVLSSDAAPAKGVSS